MIMKRVIVICMLCFPLTQLWAQVDRQKIQPPALREANVLVSKRFWRIIDLREKQNKPATWPGNPIQKKLYQALIDGQIKPYTNDSLTSAFSYEQLVKRGTRKELVKRLIDPNNDDLYVMDTVVLPFVPEQQIQHLMVMEEQFFDNRSGSERIQIIAVAPLFRLVVSDVDLGLQPLCWIKYYDRFDKETDARDVLLNSVMFNKSNDRGRFTHYDWFEQRQFSSYIIKLSNAYDISIMDDPEVKRNGIKALLTSDRIRRLNSEQEQGYFEY